MQSAHNATTTESVTTRIGRGAPRRRTKVAAFAAALCLASGGLGAGLTAALSGGTPARVNGSAHRVTVPAITRLSASIDTPQVAAKVDPAVVSINTNLDSLEGGGQAAGTGMIVSPSGEIVTNNHVVQGADTVHVTIAGHGTHVATLVGTDPPADVAVLRVSGLSNLPTVHFGNSSSIAVGDPVVAIGNALGLGGSPTVTQGIISAAGRTITAADETGSNEETLHGLLQTDAPIAPGNSGGPLVDAAGQVIGMDTAAASSGTGGASLGFAIPANTVTRVADEIATHQDLPGLVFGRPAFLGVEVVDSSAANNASNSFGSPFGFGFGLGPVATTPNGTPGVVVAAVDPNSAAANAGIQSGDVITAVDGKATATTSALSKVIAAHRPGQTVSVSLSTASGAKTVSVRLGKGPID
jgi:S1-C subfamily serine protease